MTLRTLLLAVVFDEFYHQHSFIFHTFRTVILLNSQTLTSSTRFGEYLNSGTTYTKMSQTGRIPRPAGLGQAGRPPPPRNVILQLCTYGPKHKIKPIEEFSHKNHKLRPKGLNQVKSGPFAVTNKSTKTQTDLRSNIQPSINVTEQWRDEMCQMARSLGWPASAATGLQASRGSQAHRLHLLPCDANRITGQIPTLEYYK